VVTSPFEHLPPDGVNNLTMPSGMVFYSGDRLPGWKGDFFLGGLAGFQIHRVVFASDGPRGREPLLAALRLRVRDVRQSPDGYIYFVTDAPQPTTSAQR
jgi:glucose/arabinose dehydrogenase